MHFGIISADVPAFTERDWLGAQKLRPVLIPGHT
ncbi:hypothetical protein FHT76_006466 [Rhizobium sp. BK176]|nr:hypothetical protein [Rhizobium sp. BK181]MCS3743682.1 hypothetical protein [Rhizobium sp. BK661]MCS4094757.1 hypothetical protein [Rhizobium sp. BK176]